MKKYLKSLAKKSMSLMLAVLMVLSCWVWIAPEAQAADSPHEGYYYVQVYGNYHDWSDSGEITTNKWTVTYKETGTDTEKTTTLSYVLDPAATQAVVNNVVIAAGWVKGFPTKVRHDFAKDSGFCGGNGFGVQPRSLMVGSVASTTSKSGKEVATYGDQYTAVNGGYDIFSVSYDEHKPYANSVSSSAAVEKMSISVKALGSGTNEKASFTKGGVYDQYGVRIKDLDGYKLYSDNAGSTTAYTEENGVWVSGTTVYASPDAQKGIPSTSGSQKIYLFGEGSEKKGLLAEITLTYPSYTVTVDSKGSVEATGFNPTIILNSGSQTGNWSYTGPYSATAATYPTGATATGYTFKGFWTTEQPTTGDAGINADEATFATPVSSEEFVTVYGGTEGAEYVVKDGKKYYNAGTQWDGAVHKEILGNNTFYGWWIPQDIIVKFYDVDGKYLGTKTAKYGSTQVAGGYPEPKAGYNSGAYEYKGFAGKWRDITGIEVVEGSYVFGEPATLTLTPIYTTNTYKDKYQINFIDPTNGGNLSGYSKEYTYRDILESTEIPTGIAMPNTLANDPGYTYEFTGWTSLKPEGGNYHTLAVGDSKITENTDWVVRKDITYYAVFRSTVKEYLVAFNYIDSTGEDKTELLTVPYGSAIATPSVVNRTYATGGYGYTLAGWTYKNGTNASATLDADGTIVFNNSNVFVTTNNIAPNGTAIVFTAAYGEGQPTPYTVTFKYKDATGKDKTVTGEVYHGNKIKQDLVDELANVPEAYDDGTALYTFSNLWKVTEGTAGKAEYTKDEFTSFSPTSHVTFEAIYGEGVPFYTVKYIDGAKTYEERVLAGNNIPAWVVDGKEYAPAKADTETGEYTFAGWFDAAQTDKSFEETNGTEYTTASKVTGDLTLYSQFLFSPFTFTVKFVNYDGTVFAEGDFEAGHSFKEIYDEAMTEAANGKAADETYSYTFVGWDKKVPDSFVCEGKDITYTAQYRPSYIYYTAKWYNDKASMEDAIPELEIVGQDGYLAKTSHTYEGKIYAPSVALTAPEGNVFTGWYYLKDGEEVKYERGMKITESMSFYARYDAAAVVIHTVTAVVDGVETRYTVVSGDKAEALGTPVNGYYDATYHRTFDGWYTAVTCDCEENCEHKFNLETAIEADTKIYARFTMEEHDKSLKELVTAPTYYATGSEKIWCACSRKDTEETVELDMLTDTVAPTGTIYLGTKGSWSSTDETGAAATDNDPVEFYVNADTDIVLTINDTGDVSAHNTDGKGKGIAVIQGIISTGVFGADTTEIAGIQTIFDAIEDATKDDVLDDEKYQTLNNTANYVIKLGSYGLEDGKTYIAYYYVKDKAGNVLNKNVRTAKFIYDSTAPEITIDGDNNGAKVPTYCGKAVVKGIENGSTVTVNGIEVTLTTSGAAGTSHYTITEAGNYVIKVTDKAGNSATKKIVVADGHDEIETSKAVTCTENGYEKIICAICNKEIKKVTIESEGHQYGEEVVVAPTCTEDGYTVKTCSVCGDEVKSAETPALDHEDTGRRTEVTKVATCSVTGEITTYCSACNAVIGTKEVKLTAEELADKQYHTLGNEKTMKPTCDEDGYKYEQCKYCYKIFEGEKIDKLNHENTGRYTVVTKTATCSVAGEKTTYCKVCDEPMGTEVIATISHNLKLVEYTAETDKSVDYPNGYKQYECQNTDCTHTEGKVAIEVEILTYKVTFKGAGENGDDLEIIMNAGETIEIGAVADQKKASDNDYNYTFAGWKGTDGKVAKLPITVTKNETYTAEFSAARRTYAHIFKIEGDEAAYATVIGFYNDTDKKPAINPTKKATPTETYKFAGWTTIGGADVTNFTMTEDATFYAKFTAIPVEFNINFYNEGNVLLYSASGDSAKTITYGKKDAEGNLIVPAKAPDADKHYTFAGWSYNGNIYAINAEFSGFTSSARIYATYTDEDHNFAVVNDATKTWAATCTKKGQETKACTVCGEVKVTELPMIDHNYVLQEDGSKVCSGCDDVIAAEAKEFAVTFNEKVTYNDNAPATDGTLKVYTVKEGTDKSYTAPDKDATAQYEYEFLNWTDANGNVVSTDAAITVTVTANATYTANYKATLRSYTVTYVDADRNEIDGYEFTIAYGGVVPTAPAEDPTKAYTDADHYVFNGWTVAEGTVVTGNILIQPVFIAEAHDWYATEESKDATCTEAGGTVWKCKYTGCEIKETRGGKPATDHTPKETVVAPTDKTDGALVYICEVCGTVTETKPLPDNYFKITVKVLDEDGNPQADVAVKLLTEDGIEVDLKETNDKGIVEFSVEKNTKYKVFISSTGETKKVSVDEDGKVIGGKIESKPDKVEVEEDNSCKCACHKGTFWGIIFRLFQKIIKLFTGKASCCVCPSDQI